MFDVLEGTIDQARERAREADWHELGSITEQEAQLARRRIVIVRRADARGDWRDAGYASSAQWLAQASRSEYRTAQRITRTSDALRTLPALDEAMSAGDLTLDQVAAAARVATPGDRRRARTHRGRQDARRDRARRAHARAATGRRRPGALQAARAQHDLERRIGASSSSAAHCRSSRASHSRMRSGRSPSRCAPPTRSAATPCSNGASTAPMHSSHSPPNPAAAAMLVCGVVRRR